MTEAASESVHPLSVPEWRQWLEKNHARAAGIWLISYKQATGKLRFSVDQAVETALCFGWIDSKPRSLDEERSMLWFSPRKKRQRVEQEKQGPRSKADQSKANARVGPGKNRGGQTRRQLDQTRQC